MLCEVIRETEQYIRRNNIEIHCVHDAIEIKHLERKVSEIAMEMLLINKRKHKRKAHAAPRLTENQQKNCKGIKVSAECKSFKKLA